MQPNRDLSAPDPDRPTATGLLQIRKPLAGAFLGLAVFVSAANVLLIRQNRELRDWAEAYKSQLELHPGSLMPPISGKDPHGSPLAVGYGRENNQGKKKTLVLVFSPTCRICDANWANWQRVLRIADKEGMRVVAVNVAPHLPQDYVEQHGLAGYPVIAQADASSVLAYRLRYTPQTIVIDANARVQRVWTGSLTSAYELELGKILTGQVALARGSETRE